MNRSINVCLTIAGSDNSGGAGIQADLKTFTRLGVYGTSALTCVVAEHPGRVSRIAAVEPRMVAEQIKLVFEAFPVGAVKTGMLFSSGIIRQVAKQLGKRRGLKLVVDPVMVATSGAALLKPDAERAMAKFLFPKAALVTPNLDEAARLVGRKIEESRASQGGGPGVGKKMESSVFGEGRASDVGEGGGLSGLAERKVENLLSGTV